MNEETYNNILAPIDGSDISTLVAEKAAAVAERNHSHLDLLYVIDTNSLSGVAGMSITGDVVYHLVQDSQEKLEGYRKHVLALYPELAVDIHMRFGSPKKVIASEFPTDHHIDLTVIGKSGLSRLERLIVGSVAAFVVQNSKTDVLIVQN
ncbi:universal stress protein [Weissella diestrammenae]|uniref:Universal stress protein n=1 Tax=Weissella diestrammenae TaxID=1162633 RepID=A0A7G9T6B7_9LACO|nr:universal stress protein [Weissella diestrammenae]MCM0583312.1 universal stress protein [Weissella diestrammenae]QNN75642.1 universal stress protein [Weissella diestrammenae]